MVTLAVVPSDQINVGVILCCYSFTIRFKHFQCRSLWAIGGAFHDYQIDNGGNIVALSYTNQGSIAGNANHSITF